MGKVKTPKRAGASSSSPYDRHNSSSSGGAAAAKSAASNNIFKFNKSFGQHILKNPGVADAIVAKAEIKPTDVVVEVGPGTGNLTVRLLEKARKVIAIELDPRMAAEISKRVMGTPLAKKLEVLVGDVMKLDLPPFDVFVSNTPYQISSPLTFKLLQLSQPPRTCVLMHQQEFAMRLVARCGDPLYSRLSVNAQWFSKCSLVMKVGKNNFRPPPKVESAVVKMEPKAGKDRPGVSWDEWDGMMRVSFARPNRTMRAAWLGSKEVLSMLERNYRVYCAMNNIPVDDSVLENDNEEDNAEGDANMMDLDDGDNGDDDNDDNDDDTNGNGNGNGNGAGEDDDLPSFFNGLKEASRQAPKTPSRHRKTRVAELVRAKVAKVLERDTGLAERRARQMDENDYLRLLLAFHGEGIHFA